LDSNGSHFGGGLCDIFVFVVKFCGDGSFSVLEFKYEST